MRGLQVFYPDEEQQSAYGIDYEKLYREGYRGIIFDIDNTLVRHNADSDAQSRALFRRLKQIGFAVCLLSNNKAARVERFNRPEPVETICKANKPSRRGYREAMRKMKTTPETTVFVGDQLFTDIWGARRAGIRSILVSPINPKEEIQIVLKRKLEWFVLRRYRRNKNKSKG